MFWMALLVLLINDHLLKHAELLPGPVTGKLSDFAGMVVAPVLLAAMLRVRRKGRLLVFVLVTGGFSAIKLSRLCADSVEAVMSPLRWKVWCDPTDLVALSMLPVAWWLGSLADAETRRVRNDWRACVRGAGLLLGVFACAATSYEGVPIDSGTAFLFNGTARTQTLRLYRLQAPLDCTRTLDDPATWPGPEAFVLRSCPTLTSRGFLGLDQHWKVRAHGGDDRGEFRVTAVDAGVPNPTCDAVLLEAEGLRPVVITWNGVAPIEFTGGEYFGEKVNDDHGLVLEQAGPRLFIAATSILRVLPAGFEPPPVDCPNGER